MFDNFFKYWDELPNDSGFTLFGAVHIGWLAVITVTICITTYHFRKLSQESKIKILKTLTLISLGLEAVKDIFLTVTGHMGVQYLPLEMCGLAIFVELAYAFTRADFLGEIMCIISMPGALAALLFPNWTRYPLLNFLHIDSFLLHGILVAVPILTVSSGVYLPKIKNIFKVFIFLIIVVPIVYLTDAWQGTNFMFLDHPSKGSPFTGVYEKWGYSGYMLVYAFTVLICIFVMYGVFYAIGKRIKKNKSSY